MSLSTHVLDAADGRPAVGVRVRLDSRKSEVPGEVPGQVPGEVPGERPGDDAGDGWTTVAEAVTDDDGRVREFTDDDGPPAGVHRLVFDTAHYFGDRPSFYPEVAVTFQITHADEHHHVPLLLSPFAYSTYRGS